MHVLHMGYQIHLHLHLCTIVYVYLNVYVLSISILNIHMRALMHGTKNMCIFNKSMNYAKYVLYINIGLICNGLM